MAVIVYFSAVTLLKSIGFIFFFNLLFTFYSHVSLTFV